MISSNQRIAQPGDIFVLLVPAAQELHRLRRWQASLQARYGGRPVEHIHITCQRFAPRGGQLEELCIDDLREEIRHFSAFTVCTDQLIQFYAPYWQTHVLRWRVQETDEYAEFRDKLDLTLSMVDCPSHFDRQRHASCTALNLDEEIDLDEVSPGDSFPAPLFTARELLISRLEKNQQFTIVETIYLS